MVVRQIWMLRPKSGINPLPGHASVDAMRSVSAYEPVSAGAKRRCTSRQSPGARVTGGVHPDGVTTKAPTAVLKPLIVSGAPLLLQRRSVVSDVVVLTQPNSVSKRTL